MNLEGIVVLVLIAVVFMLVLGGMRGCYDVWQNEITQRTTVELDRNSKALEAVKLWVNSK